MNTLELVILTHQLFSYIFIINFKYISHVVQGFVHNHDLYFDTAMRPCLTWAWVVCLEALDSVYNGQELFPNPPFKDFFVICCRGEVKFIFVSSVVLGRSWCLFIYFFFEIVLIYNIHSWWLFFITRLRHSLIFFI